MTQDFDGAVKALRALADHLDECIPVPRAELADLRARAVDPEELKRLRRYEGIVLAILYDGTGDVNEPSKRVWPIRAKNYRAARAAMLGIDGRDYDISEQVEAAHKMFAKLMQEKETP